MATTPIPSKQKSVKVTSNSAIISTMWPKEISCFKLEMNAELNNMNTTLPIETVSNETYWINNYRFENLSSETNYRLVTTFKCKYVSNVEYSTSIDYTESIRTLKQEDKPNSANLSSEQNFWFFLCNFLLFNLFFV
ncbi:hypothetical protein I4U23_011676 [Adineta vaga]|nr:hypothetical protein I4U23_011676 [Adineta vaga]